MYMLAENWTKDDMTVAIKEALNQASKVRIGPAQVSQIFAQCEPPDAGPGRDADLDIEPEDIELDPNEIDPVESDHDGNPHRTLAPLAT
jgi:hypothetical protein